MEQDPIITNPSPKNKQSFSSKLPILIAVSILLSALISGGGVFYWMNSNQQSQQAEISNLKNQLLTLSQPSPSPQSSEDIYEAYAGKIDRLKADPSLTIDEVGDFRLVIPFEERQLIYKTARAQVIKGSVEGMEFDLIFIWKKGNWIYFRVIPENEETDMAQLYLEKVGNEWKAYGPGTAFPDFEIQHPDFPK